jgi:glutaconate CoA-transferase subunit B
MVVTDLGWYEFRNGEITLNSLHPGCTVEQVRQNTGWDVATERELKVTKPPTIEELSALRNI